MYYIYLNKVSSGKINIWLLFPTTAIFLQDNRYHGVKVQDRFVDVSTRLLFFGDEGKCHRKQNAEFK